MRRNLLIIGTLITGILFVFFLSASVAAEADEKTNIETTNVPAYCSLVLPKGKNR